MVFTLGEMGASSGEGGGIGESTRGGAKAGLGTFKVRCSRFRGGSGEARLVTRGMVNKISATQGRGDFSTRSAWKRSSCKDKTKEKHKFKSPSY